MPLHHRRMRSCASASSLMASTTGAWWQMGCQAGVAKAAVRGAHAQQQQVQAACPWMPSTGPRVVLLEWYAAADVSARLGCKQQQACKPACKRVDAQWLCAVGDIQFSASGVAPKGRASVLWSCRWRIYLTPGVKRPTQEPFNEYEVAVIYLVRASQLYPTTIPRLKHSLQLQQ